MPKVFDVTTDEMGFGRAIEGTTVAYLHNGTTPRLLLSDTFVCSKINCPDYKGRMLCPW